MIRGLVTIGTLSSVVFFPWQLSVALMTYAAVYEPLVPLAAGMLADALYYTSYSTATPFFSLYGAVATSIALFVHSRLRTGTL